MRIFTSRQGAVIREADAGRMRSRWQLIHHSLAELDLNVDNGDLRSKFDEFCRMAAAERVSARRLKLAVASAALPVAIASTLALAGLALGSNRSQVLAAYALSAAGLSSPIYWAMRRRSRSAVAVAALTAAAVAWWATGAMLPPQPQSMLDRVVDGDDEIAIGIALGAVSTGLLLVVAAALAAVEALLRRNRSYSRRPDVSAFIALLEVITRLAGQRHLDLPDRLDMADNIAMAKRAIRRISVAARKRGDRDQRRDIRQGLRRWRRHFSAEARMLSHTRAAERATLRVCLQSMVPLLTGRYGELWTITETRKRSVRSQYRNLPVWLQRLSGAALPPAVLVGAHSVGVPAQSVEGVAVAALAGTMLLLMVATSNGSDPFALLAQFFHERAGMRRDRDRAHSDAPGDQLDHDQPRSGSCDR